MGADVQDNCGHAGMANNVTRCPLALAIKFKYSSNWKNNGKIFLSQREAAKEIGSHTDEIGHWFRELQHYGLIVQTSAGCLGVDGRGKAPSWRLTEYGHLGDPPTRDFLRWNGEPLPRRDRPKKQNPVPEIRDTPYRKSGTLLSRKRGTVSPPSVPEIRDIQRPEGVPEKGDITSKPLLGPDEVTDPMPPDPSRLALAASPQLQAAISRKGWLGRRRNGRVA